MAEAGCYYRSNHPQVRDYWEEVQRRHADYLLQIEALEAAYPGSQALFRPTPWGGKRIVGIHSQNCPGKEWKAGEVYGHWLPNRRYKKGRELDVRLRQIRFSQPSIPGMTQEVLIPLTDGSQTRIYWPSFEPLNSAFWVRWTPTRDQVESSGTVDPEIWQPAKASEYWLAKEADERRDALEVTAATTE